MNPSGFDQANTVLGPPRGMRETEVESLNVYQDRDQTISCWVPTAPELEEIQRTGRVWLHVMGRGMPPCFVSGKNPFFPVVDVEASPRTQ